MHGTGLLRDVVILLLASIPTALLFRRLGLPSVAGYLLVGALMGPHALGLVHGERDIEGLSELGVALLLFIVGLEFSVPRLLRLKRELLLGGTGQVLATILGFALVVRLFGAEAQDAVLFGFLAAMSSTALILKAYTDRKELETPHGRLGVAILLFQDLAVIPLMLAVPLVAGGEVPTFGGVVLLVGKAVLAVLVVLVTARYGFARLARTVVKHGGRELFVLSIVAVALGAALLTSALGLPLALGAFVAGLVISESEYSHHVVAEAIPFRDVFSALFFVSVGMLLDLRVLGAEPLAVAGWTLALVVGKGAILFTVARVVSGSSRVAFLVACGLFQIGEFSFVLARQIQGFSALSERDAGVFLAVAVLSMLVTPFAVQLAPALADRIFGGRGVEHVPHGPAPKKVDVVLAGFGLTGQHMARVLAATGISYRVVDLNPDAVRRGRAQGVPIDYGDVSHADGLEAAGVPGARVFVIAINDPSAARRAVCLGRELAPATHVVVRTRFVSECDELRRLGANDVVPEELETSLQVFGRVLRTLGIPRGTIALQKEIIRRESYTLLLSSQPHAPDLALVGQLLDEGAIDTIAILPNSWAAGRTLGELDLRGRSGVTVLAASRKSAPVLSPGADFVIEPGDLLVVLGEHPQIAAARAIFAGSKLDELVS